MALVCATSTLSTCSPHTQHLCSLQQLSHPPLTTSATHYFCNNPRTPQARRGGLRDTDAVDLLSTVYKATLERTGLEPGALGDIVVGSVLGPSSQRANEVGCGGQGFAARLLLCAHLLLCILWGFGSKWADV